MAYDEDYLELISSARDAIRALLEDSSEDSWIALRTGLREIGEAIRNEESRDRLTKSREELDRSMRELDEVFDRGSGTRSTAERDGYCAGEEEWYLTPIESKERIVIEALGDDRLPIRDLTQRVTEAMSGKAAPAVYRAGVEYVLRRLLAAGHIDRVKPRVGARGDLWHYFRKRDLTGPIAELERAYHDGGEAVA